MTGNGGREISVALLGCGVVGSQVVRLLTEHGTGQVLANWVVRRDTPWDERLAGWLADDCDAFVVQRFREALASVPLEGTTAEIAAGRDAAA